MIFIDLSLPVTITPKRGIRKERSEDTQSAISVRQVRNEDGGWLIGDVLAALRWE